MWRDSESEQDFLNFTEVADQIATLATSPDLLPISIGVFGTWGTGKSTVLKLVETSLTKTSPSPIIIKFDAWLYQGYDDAKAALMEVVAERLLHETKENQGLFDKTKSFASRINYFRALGMAADVGVGMALGVPPGLLTRAGSALGALVSGKLDGAVVGDIKEGGKQATEAWSKLIKPEEARTPPKEIAAFRKEFAEILKELNRPLILFIDNLDRCLPDVAIGTLEAIRLFLFLEGTAFVIAADEDMIRHSVAKHFSDPNARHVNDYLDKVIQVPMRVPQVGAEDVRAYMYSLFVSMYARDKLTVIQPQLLQALQDSWQGRTFNRETVNELAGKPSGLLEALAVCDRLAPILATAPMIGGNPRIIKRLLNAITLRRTLANSRKMNVDLATLAKLAVFERSTDNNAAQTLYRLIMEEADSGPHLVPNGKLKVARPDLPPEWKRFESFVAQWREMEPHFENVAALRPAAFLSRDVMVPAVARAGLSKAAQDAVEALMNVKSVSSPSAKAIITSLTTVDRKGVLGALLEHMREADWTTTIKGIHGAILIAQADAACAEEFKAFTATLQTKTLNKGSKALLESTGFLEKEA
jgi:predicted KAP-like P-loop ATPase